MQPTWKDRLTEAFIAHATRAEAATCLQVMAAPGQLRQRVTMNFGKTTGAMLLLATIAYETAHSMVRGDAGVASFFGGLATCAAATAFALHSKIRLDVAQEARRHVSRDQADLARACLNMYMHPEGM